MPRILRWGLVKSLAYMRAEVLRVAGVPSDEPSFRALDLNLEISVRHGKWSVVPTISGPALPTRLSVEVRAMSRARHW